MSDILDLTNYSPEDLPEGEIHAAGSEVEARISRVSKDVDKNGTPYIMPWFEDATNPNVEDWNDYLPLPVQGETDKVNGKRIRRLNEFGLAFDLDLFNEQFNLDEAKNKTGWMIVGVGKGRDGEDQNSVSKYLASQS